MSRALSLTCAAILATFASASTAQAAKPSIAVLGLEVVDPSGTPTPADTAVAEGLTRALRTRAQAVTGTYTYVPRSEKELIDEKVLNNCSNEAIGCMSTIAKQVGADVLIYGRIEHEHDDYKVTVTLLDAVANKRSQPVVAHLPLNPNERDLDVEARKIYSRLTGDTGAGTLDVRLVGADRGTISVDGEPKGTISSGSGEVTGLSEGRHHLHVEVGGYQPWERDVTVTAGQTAHVTIDNLQRAETGSGEGGGTTGISGTTGLGIGTTPTPEHRGNSWRTTAIGSAVVTGVLTVGFGLTWYELSTTGHIPGGGPFDYGNDCTKTNSGAKGPGQCASGSTWHTATYVTGIGAGVAAIFTGYAIYKGWVSHSGSSTDQARRGHRVHRERFVVTPVISPNGGGATLRFEW